MSAAARSFWSRLHRALGDGHRVLLAVVAESSVHSPGTAGAKMFVTEGGERVGTIGGGVMELRLLERADEMLAPGGQVPGGQVPGGQVPRGPWAERAEMVHRQRLDEGDAEDRAAERSGMICAGRQTNLYALLCPPLCPPELYPPAHRPDDEATTARLLELLERGEGWWGLDASGHFAVGDEDLDVPRSLDRRPDGWTFRESLVERRRLAILGGGHCGQALARLMAGVGWHVAVWETRAQVIDDADLDGIADLHRVDDFRHAAAAIERPEQTPVVVMTTDVPNDVRALEGVLRDERGIPFVGAMGSAAKLDEIRRRLEELGLPPERIETITAPVGLEIDSHTPPEIAVSVAAQLLQLRHRWLGG